IFDIEFNKDTTFKQVEKITLDLEIEGQILKDTATNLFYWRQIWKNKINKYSIIENIDDITDRVITNIPKSNPENQIIVASKEIQNNLIQKYHERYNSDISEYNSDDSDYIKQQKRKNKILGKRKNFDENNIEFDKIDKQQLQIQQNYQENLLNKRQKKDEIDNFNYNEEIKLDIKYVENNENLPIKFARINQNNSYLKGLERLLKKV
ncbi:8912_t:CDS:2, partial [Dentiscutata erythropus]